MQLSTQPRALPTPSLLPAIISFRDFIRPPHETTGTGQQGTGMGSEKMWGRVDEEDQMMRRMERTRGTSIKTVTSNDQRRFSPGLSSPLVQPFSKPAFHFRTLTVFTTHTSSNPVFPQGLIQIDAYLFISCPGQFNQTPCSAGFNMTTTPFARGRTNQLLPTKDC